MTARIMETGGGAVMEKNSGNHRVDEIFAKLKEAKNPKEKRKLLNELWAEIKPKVSQVVSELCRKYKSLLNRYRPGIKTEDLESEAYEKLITNSEKFLDAENFYNYFITTVRHNFFDQYVKPGMKYKEKIDGPNFVEGLLQSEHSRNGDKIEEGVALKEIKDRLIGWVKSGALSPTEVLVLILHYGLGEKLIRDFVNEFKDEPVSNTLRNINFTHVDFDAGMTFEGIAGLLGLANGTPKGIESRAIIKIKNKLKIL